MFSLNELDQKIAILNRLRLIVNCIRRKDNHMMRNISCKKAVSWKILRSIVCGMTAQRRKIEWWTLQSLTNLFFIHTRSWNLERFVKIIIYGEISFVIGCNVNYSTGRSSTVWQFIINQSDRIIRFYIVSN